MLMGMGLLALSERLKNQEEPIARIAHVASSALGTGLVVYSTRQAYRLLNSAPHPRAYIVRPIKHSTYSPTRPKPYSCT